MPVSNLRIIGLPMMNGEKLNQVSSSLYWEQKILKSAVSATPTGKVPILAVDEKILVESGAIYRYLGKQFNLRPKCDWDNAQMESAVDYYNNLRDEIRPFLRLAVGLTTEGDREKLYTEQFLPASDRAFQRYTQLLANSKSEFLADSGFSWGDFVIAEKY